MRGNRGLKQFFMAGYDLISHRLRQSNRFVVALRSRSDAHENWITRAARACHHRLGPHAAFKLVRLDAYLCRKLLYKTVAVGSLGSCVNVFERLFPHSPDLDEGGSSV